MCRHSCHGRREGSSPPSPEREQLRHPESTSKRLESFCWAIRLLRRIALLGGHRSSTPRPRKPALLGLGAGENSNKQLIFRPLWWWGRILVEPRESPQRTDSGRRWVQHRAVRSVSRQMHVFTLVVFEIRFLDQWSSVEELQVLGLSWAMPLIKAKAQRRNTACMCFAAPSTCVS